MTEAMEKGGWLLRFWRMPELKTKTEIEWNKGEGKEFEALCELLKGNAIPLTSLIIHRETSVLKRIISELYHVKLELE